MRVLVAGHSGQVARALVEAAEGRHEILAVGRPDYDLTDPTAAERAAALFQPDVIINAAAYTAVDKAESEEDLATAVNVAAADLARAAVRRSIPFLHISTDYVFDGSKVGAYVESDPVAPLGAYGRSKLKAEQAVAAAMPDALILRTAWVFHHEGANFVKTMLRLAESRDRLGVVMDQRGCPTYAADIAEALLAIAEKKVADPAGRPGGLFHMSGAGPTSWYDFACAIFAGAAQRGGKAPVVDAIPSLAYPTPTARPANSVLDCSKLADLYDVRLPAWSDALERCLDRLIGTKKDRV